MEPVARTPFGAVRGVRRGAVDVFSGIKFATAERFAAPMPVTSWDGVLDGSAFGAQCPQSMGLIEQAIGSSAVPMDEDCLHLNVSTPGCDDDRRPVLVWIHGGAFTSGSGSMPWYDAAQLVQRGDVVVVTINYRLGAFGYAGPGNLGTRDQIVALRWVHDAIAAFGGDPANVTLFGESAGGSAIVALMATPSASGLFARGFAMSPSITQLRSRERAEEALSQYLVLAGARSLDELRDQPVSHLLAAQSRMLGDEGSGFTGFSPCADGELIPEPIVEAAGRSEVPLVLGTTRDEMSLFTAFNPELATFDRRKTVALFARSFGAGAEAAMGQYERARGTSDPRLLISAMQTDEVFRVPARRLAEARASAGDDTWMYWFTWATPAFGGVLGSCHAVDVPFAFHNLDRTGVEQFTGTSTERVAVADAYTAALLAFAKTGDPGWPRYDTERRATRRIDVTSETLEDPEGELRVLWELTTGIVADAHSGGSQHQTGARA